MRVVLGCILAFVTGAGVYALGWAPIGAVGPRSYATYGEALAVSLTPMTLGLATMGVLAWRALRRRAMYRSGR